MKNLIIAIVALLMCMAYMANAGQLATLSIVDQTTGGRLQIWRHDGLNYVAGSPGDRYAVEIKNQTGARLLAIVSVDGANVVNGETAAINQSGYVLDAWQQPLAIKGWRKNMDEVAAFYFTRLPDSYAARTGRPDNVGVIGVALFQEFVEPPPAMDSLSRNSMPPSAMAGETAQKKSMGRAAEASADARLGTGHGERLPSRTQMTDFRRATPQANEVLTIYYDTYAHLVARGIIPRRHQHAPSPDPFPGGFTPDPS